MIKLLKIFGVVFLLGIGGLAAVKVQPHVYRSECVGCEDCIRICPQKKKGAIVMIDGKAVINPEVCVACGSCVTVCSYNAVRK